MNELILQSNLPQSQNPAATLLAGCSTRNTHRAYERCLNNIANIFGVSIIDLDWTAIRFQHATAIRSHLIQAYDSAATVNQHLSALRGVLEQSFLLGYMEGDEYQRIKKKIENIKEVKDPVGRYVSDDDLNKLLETCGNDVIGIRDQAIFLIATYTGMRISEIVKLNVKDYNSEDASLFINKAKGNKSRTVYIAGRAKRALNRWMGVRAWESDEDALFCTTDKNMGRLTSHALRKRLREAVKAAGIENFTFHSFRRKFISDALDKGIDENSIIGFTGHASKDMLTKYDRRGERAKQNAALIFAGEDEE